MGNFTVLDLLDLDLKEHNALNLRCIAGRKGLGRELTVPNINRPGLGLSGFYEKFAYERLQIFGNGENAYLKMLDENGRYETIRELFTYPIPCCIFTNSAVPTPTFIEIAENAVSPILQTDLATATFVNRVIRALEDVFAPTKVIHGVMVEVYGIGVLIHGSSGVGKSEAALELIERGHRLISDDSVEIRCVSGNILLGSGSNPALAHHMEIRGLGIININHLFGIGSIRDKKQIELVVNLEEWDPEKNYDRVGSGNETMEILGVQIPLVEIPVKPGRNIPILIETAAMNERLKKRGYHSAHEFNKNILKWLESENARNMYFQKKDII